MLTSWRITTKRQYKTYLDKWCKFCQDRNKNPLLRDSNLVLEFLNVLFVNKCSYSAINTARSALSSIFFHPPIGEHILIKRFMRAVYNDRPNLPRYNQIWDVSKVLKHLEQLSPGKTLSLLQLSQKLATLMALVTGQRSQTLSHFNLDDLVLSKNSAKFHVKTLLKHDSVYNKQGKIITLAAFPENKHLCVATYLRQYINRTRDFRKSQYLFIGSQSPHSRVSSSTISRWVKSTLQKAGINTEKYSAHSTRAASTSAASKSLDLGAVLAAANWTNSSTFGRYYNKPLEDRDNSTAFGLAVLRSK